jgi:hypothetical protein
MYKHLTITTIAASLLLAPMTACESLPGDRTSQSTVIGGAAGAAAGALIGGEGNRLVGALIGGAAGAGGGYLIGAETDWFEDDADKDADTEARQAVKQAQNDPATAAQARDAQTADVNGDGFVTLDEVVAMQQAGFSNAQMIDRLEATGQVFDLNAEQRDYLRDNGVNNRVIARLPEINRETRDEILPPDDRVISG